jgi:hypothetical protein
MVRRKLGDPALPVKAAAAPSTQGRTPATPVAVVRRRWQTRARLLFVYRLPAQETAGKRHRHEAE